MKNKVIAIIILLGFVAASPFQVCADIQRVGYPGEEHFIEVGLPASVTFEELGFGNSLVSPLMQPGYCSYPPTGG
jgi:hypothetical protein